jgi:hypothetical protein
VCRIDILVHKDDTFHNRYYLFPIVEMWREAGMDVRVIRGPIVPANADLVVVHTDITRVPAEYLAQVRQYPKAVNGYAADISKRLVSRHLVSDRENYSGPVIVKTDANCGASQEAYFDSKSYFPSKSQIETQNYRIYESPRDVPDSVWQSRIWVVEKFLPEVENGMFCLRTWVFLGEMETVNRSYSYSPIVKGRNAVKREVLDDVPAEIRALREELAFDYGKFDFVVADGVPVLYDANRTPTLGILTEDEYLPRLRRLAEGIRAFL